MEKYHRFKKKEFVWCTLYPGVYEVLDVLNREIEKGRPYSDLLILKLQFPIKDNHSPTETLDELHCEKLDVGIEKYKAYLKETSIKLDNILTKYNEQV